MGIQEIVSGVSGAQSSVSGGQSASRIRPRADQLPGRFQRQDESNQLRSAPSSLAPNRDEVEARVEQAIGRYAAEADEGEVQDLGAPLSDDEKIEASLARQRSLVSAYGKIDSRLNQLSE